MIGSCDSVYSMDFFCLCQLALQLISLSLLLCLCFVDTFFVGLLMTIWEMKFLYACFDPVSDTTSLPPRLFPFSLDKLILIEMK
jgi:hypothetical protein